jgi:hypothetical protein
MPPSNGSFRMNTSPGAIRLKAPLIAAIAVDIEPRWPGSVRPCAAKVPASANIAVE